MQLINPYYPKKIGVKERKATQRNCCKGVPSTPLLRSHTPNDGVKMQQKLLSSVSLPLVIYLSGNDLLNMSCFLKSSWMVVWKFCTQDLFLMNCFVLVVLLTDERLLALFPAGTMVRDHHHRESPLRRGQDLNLRRTWVSLCWIKFCGSDNHYTTALQRIMQ